MARVQAISEAAGPIQRTNEAATVASMNATLSQPSLKQQKFNWKAQDK